MEARMQILTSKKLIASALTFVLVLTFSGLPLPASKWQMGSSVEVALTDGRSVSGELLAVKGRELIIHDRSIDRGFTVNIEQVLEIKIKKKSRVISGLAIGLIVGLGIGVGIAKNSGGRHSGGGGNVAIMSFSSPFIAATLGGMMGGSQSRPKTISFKEQPPIQVEGSLRYLENHARWRNKWKDINPQKE
jgi:hypothetical protein